MPTVKSKCIYKYVDFDIPDGFFFAPLRKDYGKVTLAHPLDNGIDYKILNEKIIPICSSYYSAPEFYGERVKQVIERTLPSYHPCFSFIVELLSRLIVLKQLQTEKQLELLRTLRIIFELYFSSTAIMDDISDNSAMRKGKPTWHTTCEGGLIAAVYDAIFLENMVHHLLKVYYGNTPVFPKMVAALARSNAVTCIGQTMDILDKPTELTNISEVVINPFKSGYSCKVMANFALLHAGITDEDITDKVETFISELFITMQAWNDFNDSFCTFDATGKNIGEDIVNGRPSWVCQTALVHFNDEQKAKFLKCYGSSNEQDIQTIYDLYSEVNIPRLYLEFMKKMNKKCDSVIEKILHQNVKRACINCKEWFYGKI